MVSSKQLRKCHSLTRISISLRLTKRSFAETWPDLTFSSIGGYHQRSTWIFYFPWTQWQTDMPYLFHETFSVSQAATRVAKVHYLSYAGPRFVSERNLESEDCVDTMQAYKMSSNKPSDKTWQVVGRGTQKAWAPSQKASRDRDTEHTQRLTVVSSDFAPSHL